MASADIPARARQCAKRGRARAVKPPGGVPRQARQLAERAGRGGRLRARGHPRATRTLEPGTEPKWLRNGLVSLLFLLVSLLFLLFLLLLFFKGTSTWSSCICTSALTKPFLNPSAKLWLGGLG